MKKEPGLVDYVKDLSREQLERKFLLRKMQERDQKEGYSAKVKTWLEKPEQADLVKSIKATISPNMKPERQEQASVTHAENFIRNQGIKLGRHRLFRKQQLVDALGAGRMAQRSAILR